MKSRVIASLNALACVECPENYLSLQSDLEKETNLSREKLRLKAEEILWHILHNYASFDISTIDRFTHKILRTFAKDLGIPLNFEVELDTLRILQEAVDRLIGRAGDDNLLTKVMINYTLTKADDDKSWDISRDLYEYSKILISENHQKYVNTLKGKTLDDFKHFGKKIRKAIESSEKDLSETADAFFAFTNSEGLEKKDFTRGYVYEYFVKLYNKDYKINFDLNWQNNIRTDKLYSASVSSRNKNILDANQEKIADLFEASRTAIFRREYFKEVLKSLTPLSLLSEIANEVEKIKKERSLVLISDFNPIISSEVNNQPVPFIYERMGERYRNYFIDEFQDTSEMQWQNIIPLIDHALSVSHEEKSGLTLVGDAKQSIYRFRGGKAEQFIGLYSKEKSPFLIEPGITDLPCNYRSAKEIVTFNNSFFQFIANQFNNETYKSLFSNCAQIAKKEEKGYVNISFIEAENADEEKELFPQKVFEIIQDLEEKGTLKSDISILTRTRKEGALIANYLNENGIPIVSSESLLVSNSPEVAFINEIFRFFVNPDDKEIKWQIINFISQQLNLDNEYEILVNNLSLDHHKFFSWLQPLGIYFDLQQLDSLSIYEAAEYIIRSFNLVKEPNAYLQFYLDYIFDKTSKIPVSINEFLELWELDKDKLSIVAPKGNDAVQVMTIHTSKGLEFPVVIYPFANTALKDVKKENLWLPLPENYDDISFNYFKANKKMLNWGEVESAAYQELVDQTEFDNINTLYVALTRAAEKLYVLSCYDLKDGNEKTDKISGLLIGYLKNRNIWNDGLIYEFGENSISSQLKEKNSAQPLQKFYSSPTSNHAVSIVTRSGSLWGTSQQEAIERGNLLHEVLALIDTEEDIPLALDKFSAMENFTEERKAELKQILMQVITNPQISPYFSKDFQIYRERDIISPGGEILRPDRLVIKDGEATLIDYKTGGIQESHKQQMNKYESVINLLGLKVEKKILVYINKEVNLLIV